MKRLGIFLIILCTGLLGTFSYKVTGAFLNDTETSTNNTFTAAAFATATPTPTPSPTPIPGIANHVVISEVQARGLNPNGAAKDFVELYNPTNTSFDLNGYRLVRRNGNAGSDTTLKSWATLTIIPAHGFYLWANSENGFGASINADTTTTLNFGNSASIALRFGPENTGTIIDAVSWHAGASSLQEGTAFSPNPGQGESLERKALSTSTITTMGIGGVDELKGNGFDLNDNATDFILRVTSQPQNTSSPAETP